MTGLQWDRLNKSIGFRVTIWRDCQRDIVVVCDVVKLVTGGGKITLELLITDNKNVVVGNYKDIDRI